MTKLGPYKVHPFADAFPLIDGEEFGELVQDIKKNGLRELILLSHDGTTLIDGRNRYRACEAAGVDVAHETLGAHYTEPMILDLIASKNLARRQLNPGQRAFAAMKYWEMHDAVTKEKERARKSTSLTVAESIEKPDPTSLDLGSPESGKTADKAAKAVGASRASVENAKFVENYAPDLAAAVKAGRLSLDAAHKQAKNRKKSEPKPDPKPKPSLVMLTLRTHTGDEVAYPKPKGKPTFNETTGEGISWAAWSWNPVTGCLHGCDYCYARAIAHRYPDSYPAGFTPLFHEERLDAPSNTTIPERHRDDPAYRRVFVCSMADLYGRWVPAEWIDRIHGSMLAAPDWEYLLLTKFPDRYVGLDLPASAWVGTSVDEQKRVRIAERAFRQIEGVKVKWLSLEPLTEPLEFEDLSMFDWVVIGAQTETYQPDGPVAAFAPPFEWVARLVAQAREAGCKVHLKPNLVNGKPGMALPDEDPTT